MRRILKWSAVGIVGSVLAGPAAFAQQAATPRGATLSVTPGPMITAPHEAVRGFDSPKPLLKLQAPGDSAAIRGLAPGQDLVGDAGPGNPRRSAADTDTYFASKEYQQKAETIERKGHMSAGRQFAGAAEAGAMNLAIGGIGTLLSGQ